MTDPLGAGPEDLAANRAGRLGPGQLHEQARRRAFAAAGCGFAGGALILGGVVSNGNGGQWVVPLVLGVLVIGVGVWRALSGRRESAAPVRCLEGPVSVSTVSRGRAGVGLRLTVDGQGCSVAGRLADWQATLTEPAYRVYVTGGELPEVVGIEPATAR